MATAQAKRLHAETGKKVVVVGFNSRVEWHPVFENNPKLLKAITKDCVRVKNCSGMRPYIERKTPERWYWKRWRIEPGEIYLSEAEKAFAAPHAGHILIEPNTKVEGSNKAWLIDRWQELVDRGGDFVQIGPAGTRVLRGVRYVETPSFRHGAAVLAVSRAFVGTEGGLHHAAAALGVPAVVLFSEFISPDITGYAMHRNIRHAGATCGARIPCSSCRASMEAITVDEVEKHLKEITA